MTDNKQFLKAVIIGVFFIVVGSVYGSGDYEGGTYHGVDVVDIESDSIPFEIRGTSSRVVDVKIGRLASNVRVEVDHRGDRLSIDVDRRFNPFAWGKSDPIIVFVPQDTELGVSVASASIELSNIRSDVIHVKSASGSIRAESIEGDIALHASSGSIRLEEAAGDVEVSAVSGTIRVSNFDGALSARASSGSVRVEDTTGVIIAKSTSGSVRIDNFRATGDCSFETVSGSIDVNFANNADDLRFELRGVSGSLRAFGEKGSRTLNVGNGHILITGSSTSGSQRYE